MAKQDTKNSEAVPEEKSRFTPLELAEVSHVFNTNSEVVLAALKGVDKITIDDAKEVIAQFLKKEVK